MSIGALGELGTNASLGLVGGDVMITLGSEFSSDSNAPDGSTDTAVSGGSAGYLED
jgi:hypothetical protein